MTTTILVWVSLTFDWSGGATVAAGPVVWMQASDSAVADTVQLEPCSISYETAAAEIAIETRIETFIAMPR